MKVVPRLKKNPRYVDIMRHWRKIKPVITSDEAKSIWLPCMLEYGHVRAEDYGFVFDPKKREYNLPRDFDGCDWRWNRDRRGRHPAFWDYVCHSACHWVVDLNLYVAVKVFPEFQWRIVSHNWTKNGHSTVWNGSTKYPLLFDMNFLALQVGPMEAWRIATKGRIHKPNQFLKSYNFKVRL